MTSEIDIRFPTVIFDRSIVRGGSVALLGLVATAVAVVVNRRRRANNRILNAPTGPLAAASLAQRFEDYFALSGMPPDSWEANGRSVKKLLSPGSVEYHQALDLIRSLDGQQLVGAHAVVKIYAVCNPALALNFTNQRGIIGRRLKNDPHIFAKTDWNSTSDRRELRRWVMHNYRQLCLRYPWNNASDLTPVIPVVHGTSAAIANKIVDNGFSALSSVDAGFYGKGMYFASSCRYTLPYYAAKPDPAILICLAVPGNPYPVVESRTEEGSLLGLPIKSGYQSNYVLTLRDGNPCTHQVHQKDIYDELIVDQESQVVPILLVEFDSAKLGKMAMAFQRATPQI